MDNPFLASSTYDVLVILQPLNFVEAELVGDGATTMYSLSLIGHTLTIGVFTVRDCDQTGAKLVTKLV